MPRFLTAAATVLGGALVVVACQVENPTAPDLDGPDLGKGRDHHSRMKVCHVEKDRWYHHHKWFGRHKKDKHEKRYHEIWINSGHERWHRSHGDGKIGDEYPGKHGHVFGRDCKPEASKGSLAVIKLADAEATFDFEGSPELGSFPLATGDTIVFEDLNSKIDFNILETLGPDFTLESASCTLADGEPTGDPDVLGVTDIQIERGKTTTCIFVNTSVQAPATGALNVVKVTDVAGEFSFLGSSPIDAFTLSAAPGTPASQLLEGLDAGITYAISEDALAGFELQTASCLLDDGTATGTGNASGVDDIVIEPGLTTTCTFTNVAVQAGGGSLNVVKTSDIAGVFNYTGTPSIGSFSLDTGSPTTSGQVFDGLDPLVTYAVTELQTADFMLISATCSLADGTPTGTREGDGITGIAIVEGETTTCSFFNISVPQTGSLRIVKSSDVAGTFSFVGSPTIGMFSLAPTEGAPAENTFGDLDAQVTYSVIEDPNSAFTLESASCTLQDGTATGTTDPQGVTGIELRPGETTTCSFVNAAVPAFGVLRVVVVSEGAGVFELTGEPTIGDFTVNTEVPESSEMSFELTDVSVLYSVTQALNPVFEFAGAQCLLEDLTETGTLTDTTVSEIVVELGRTTTCTFTNTAPPVGPPLRDPIR